MVGPMSAAATNRLLAVEAVRWALAHGVAEVVLCAGARNLPLVAAWLGVPAVRLWHHPEERSAAFFALGRIQAGAGPVAVVVTSGTAAAELLPAAIEGHLQGLPLLLLTADRPRQFRGSAAPQTIVQPGLFGAYAPTLADASCAADVDGLPGSVAKRPVGRKGGDPSGSSTRCQKSTVFSEPPSTRRFAPVV